LAKRRNSKLGGSNAAVLSRQAAALGEGGVPGHTAAARAFCSADRGYSVSRAHMARPSVPGHPAAPVGATFPCWAAPALATVRGGPVRTVAALGTVLSRCSRRSFAQAGTAPSILRRFDAPRRASGPSIFRPAAAAGLAALRRELTGLPFRGRTTPSPPPAAIWRRVANGAPINCACLAPIGQKAVLGD
jgi:hypothetical protein